MRIERLCLTDFRNYAHLDLALPAGLVVFSGRNAQGKSNILEAVTLCAMSKSFRTANERELVRFGAEGHFTRVEATVIRRRDQVKVEVVVAPNGTVKEARIVGGHPVLATAAPRLPGPGKVAGA